MEQLQRQQQARLEMERKEQRLREAHVMYVQQVAAQQAILAAARTSGGLFSGKASECRQGGGESGRSCGEGARDSEGEDEEDEEAMEDEEGCEEDAASGGTALEYLREQSLALQKATSRLPAHPCPPYLAPGPQCATSPPVRVKQEPEEESRSPAGPPSATSPNGQADWSYEEQLKQNGSAAWADEADGGRGRGEASRDFAKLYELDNDPNRKEFLDDLFAYMQKRGEA
ncbi:AT-rich interactive domain-containing protein 3B-like isoform X1 [Brienomyrus brachyistius]|nr:AT-rich interactive domain-containing protein 3B-like isoform X1 [Brienomyrus brachyistius]XP_048861493.1 AT-rich interactive domain-containing protein 3B-like isoform X1 [Brienomyrus brachyistius]